MSEKILTIKEISLVINKLIRNNDKFAKIQQIILFGSYVINTPKLYSDINLCITAPTGLNIQYYADLETELSEKNW